MLIQKARYRELADRDAVLKNLGVSFNKKYLEEVYDLDSNHFDIKEPVTGFGFEDHSIFKDMGLKSIRASLRRVMIRW